jgi:cobalt-precorrin-5B (C1)-methyltransferase
MEHNVCLGRGKIRRKEMEELQPVWGNHKKLRWGYTTGSCAAAAAKAAVTMLLTGEEIRQVSLLTPKGIQLYLEVEEIRRQSDRVSCAVRKDSGDDPDVTNRILVFAEVSKTETDEIVLDGGVGVGRVTRKGLEQEIGRAAINKVPREMIRNAVQEQADRYGYGGGLQVLISIPDGVRLAEKTFNPRLGITGGISVLGTSGIVEPMSEKALLATIRLEKRFLKENGHDWCYIVPGNYGNDFLRDTLGYHGELAVKCSNYIGETLDVAVQLHMEGILLVGHVGKLVKVAAGVMNTHSRQADCRMEIFAAHAAMAGASGDTVRMIMESVVTAEAIAILRREGILEEVMRTIVEKVVYHLRKRSGGKLIIGAILFSEEEGILGQTSNVRWLLERIQSSGDKC